MKTLVAFCLQPLFAFALRCFAAGLTIAATVGAALGFAADAAAHVLAFT